MGSEWYVFRDGETFGPFSFERMLQGAREREMRADDRVWCEGMPDWLPAADVPELWKPPNESHSAPAPVVRQSENAVADELGAPVTPGGPRCHARGPGDEHGGKAEPARPRAGLIVRHWRGELPLGLAYWGAGFALTILVVALSGPFYAWLDRVNLAAVPLGIVLASFLSFLCAMSVWQMVGIWRAAGNHIKLTGRQTWAVLARVAVVVGAIRFMVDFTTVLLPMLKESVILATGREDIPPHRMRILRNGTELELAGGMPFGTAEALGKLLDAAPSVKVLHLNSIGGRVREGYLVYRMVRDRQLATYTSADCVSACTIAFLGGSRRYLSSRARLGFHSTSFGTVDQSRLPGINTDVRRILARHGAPRWFIDKALTTSASSMWYPSHRDLLAAKIVTRVVDPDDFGWSGVADWRDKEALLRNLLAIPLYRLIKDDDPKAFKTIADRFLEELRLGKSQPEVVQAVQGVFHNQVLPKYLQVAPDGVVQRYWRTQVAEMEHLRKADPVACVAYAYPETRPAGYNLRKLIPRALLADDIAALTELVRQAIRAPDRRQSNNVDSELADVVARISSRIPDAQGVLAEPHRYFKRPGMLCSALLAFYTDILRLPERRSGPVLRALAQP